VHKGKVFIGVSTLGICEQDTLAGVLAFQMACNSSEIKPIIGETVTVKGPKDNLYKVKLYCLNEIGWRNLLNINSQIKVFNDGFVSEDYIANHCEGLVCVIDCSTKLSKELIKGYSALFGDNLYYQFDPVEWSNPTKETEHLELMKDYISNYIDHIAPVIICDSYYLDSDESHVRKMLNTIGKVGFQNQSTDQHFKSISDIVNQCDELFKG